MEKKNYCTRIITSSLVAGVVLANASVVVADDFALHFDGVAGEATSEANFDLEHLTVEAWVNAETVHLDPCCTFAGLVTWGSDDDAAWEFGIVGDPAGGPLNHVYPFFQINWGKADAHALFSTKAVIDLNEWTHIAATYDGVTAKMYINGELVDDADFDVPMSQGGDDAHMSIGNNFPGGNEYFGGTLDHVRIWNVARNSQQITKTMRRPLVGTEPGLFAYYDLNEGEGATLNDKSGNSRHANLTVAGKMSSNTAWVESTSPVEFKIGDLDMSGNVNVTDLLMLLGAWGSCEICDADLNSNGVVNVSDLLILLSNYGSDR